MDVLSNAKDSVKLERNRDKSHSVGFMEIIYIYITVTLEPGFPNECGEAIIPNQIILSSLNVKVTGYHNIRP